MKKNVLIYAVAGVVALGVIGFGGTYAVKKINENKKAEQNNEAVVSTYNYETIADYNEENTQLAEEENAQVTPGGDDENVEIFTAADGKTYRAEILTNADGQKVTNAAGENVTRKPVEVKDSEKKAVSKPSATAKSSATTKVGEKTTTKAGATTKPSGTTQKADPAKKSDNQSKTTTTKKSTTTKKTTTTNKKPATTKPSTPIGGGNKLVYDENGNASIVNSKGELVLNYSYSNTGNYFYTDDNPWQRNFGFNRIYDMSSAFIVLYYDTVRVKYPYGGYNWMVQMWKGQYGLIFIGSEIGLYYQKGSGVHYECATEDMEIMMQMTLYRDGRSAPLFTRPYASHWWTTAFVPGKLKQFSDRSELTMVGKLTFKTEAEAKLFCSSLAAKRDVDGNQFKAVSAISPNNPETYSRKGATVDFVWRNFDEDRTVPKNPVTTTKPPVTTTQPPVTTQPPTTTVPPVTDPIHIDD